MRNFIPLGIVSFVAYAGMLACSDDDTDRRSGLGGSGGGAGSAGSAGSGGTSGAGGTGGSTGGAGGGSVDMGPPPDVAPLATCTGCVELIAPVVGPRSADNVADEASYIFSLGAPVDFSQGQITWRIAAVQPNANYAVVVFAQNGQDLGYAGAYAETALDPAAFPANQFRDVTLDLSRIAAAPGDAGVPDAGEADAGNAGGVDADAGDAGGQPVRPPPNVIGTFDKSQIIQLGIFVGVTEAFSGSATVRVAVDQVTIAGVPGQLDRTFTTGTENLGINQYNIPPNTPPPVHHP
ncbi:MAG: hypothetical protein ABI895_23670 [Deltaproteobacteria bacterium]